MQNVFRLGLVYLDKTIRICMVVNCFKNYPTVHFDFLKNENNMTILSLLKFSLKNKRFSTFNFNFILQ